MAEFLLYMPWTLEKLICLHFKCPPPIKRLMYLYKVFYRRLNGIDYPFNAPPPHCPPPAALTAVTGYFTAMPQWTAYEAGEMTAEQLAEGVTRFSRAVLEPVMGSQLEAAGQVRGS